MGIPQSRLTVERPDIWHRALALATRTTGCIYAPKLPLPDGTIYCCGGGGYIRPYTPPDDTPVPLPPSQGITDDIDREIDEIRGKISDLEESKTTTELELERIRAALERLRRHKKVLENDKLLSTTMYIPEGDMEWLLHEVGHWLAASPHEKALPNYGLADHDHTQHGALREQTAFAFQGMVMAPYGHSREFTSPSRREGPAFEGPAFKAGILPAEAIRRAEVTPMDTVEEFRRIYSDWFRWGRVKGHRSTVAWDSLH